jgi:hypothetical protein
LPLFAHALPPPALERMIPAADGAAGALTLDQTTRPCRLLQRLARHAFRRR